jgi:GT2 family glycosyltransferase
VIVFGTGVTDEEAYRRWALPSIERVREPDSLVIAKRGAGSLQGAYNEILDEAATKDDLEAVVLLHQDVELVSTRFLARLRHVLSRDEVAVVGTVGARGVRTIAWWEHRVSFGRVGWPEVMPSGVVHGDVTSGVHAVDVVDGLLLVLSGWAARLLLFDPRFAPMHGYDVDLCFAARAAGGLVVATDLDVVHHTDGVFKTAASRRDWVASYYAFHRKWSPDRVRAL